MRGQGPIVDLRLLLVSLPGYGRISLSGAVGIVFPRSTAFRCAKVPAVRKEARLRDGLQRSTRAGASLNPTVYVLSGPGYIVEVTHFSRSRLGRDLMVFLEVSHCRSSTRPCVLLEVAQPPNCSMSMMHLVLIWRMP